MTDMPTPPAGLGLAGEKFWTDTLAEYELVPHERVILEDCCREIDMIARLEAAVQDADLIVMGSMKQPVISPLVPELRQHRATVVSLIRALRFDRVTSDDTSAQGHGVVLPMTRAEAARRAANARWDNR